MVSLAMRLARPASRRRLQSNAQRSCERGIPSMWARPLKLNARRIALRVGVVFLALVSNEVDAKSGGQFESGDAPRLWLGKPLEFPVRRHHGACARFAQFVGKQPQSLPDTGPTIGGDVLSTDSVDKHGHKKIDPHHLSAMGVKSIKQPVAPLRRRPSQCPPHPCPDQAV